MCRGLLGAHQRHAVAAACRHRRHTWRRASPYDLDTCRCNDRGRSRCWGSPLWNARAHQRPESTNRIRPPQRPVRSPHGARRRLLRSYTNRRRHGPPDQRPQRREAGCRTSDNVSDKYRRRWRLRAVFHVTNRCAPHGPRPPAHGGAADRHALARAGDSRAVRGGAGAFQHDDDARAGEPRRCPRGSGVSAGARRARSIHGAQRRVSREEHAARTAVRRHEPGVRSAGRARCGDRSRRRRDARTARHDHRRRVRRVRPVPRHVDLAAHRVRLGGQPVPARRGIGRSTAGNSG